MISVTRNFSTIIIATVVVLQFICSCKSAKNSGAQPVSHNQGQRYLVFNSFTELINNTDSSGYPKAMRITSGKENNKPAYHGFFFYNCAPADLLQFDPTGRYMVGMQVSIEGREVLPTDTAYIGLIDLLNDNQWTTIGHTTAWNWQQGCRLEWLPGSANEIIWDARAEDGKSFISCIYNTKTKTTRKLPRPIYTVSPDGTTALTHDFERMEHGGTNYVGIPDRYAGQWAPAATGIFTMNIKTGENRQIVSVRDMVQYMFPAGMPADTLNGRLYIFREGYNPSGNRFIAFVKDVRVPSPGDTTVRTAGFSMNAEGKDIRYLYEEPSHHYWINDSMLLDNVSMPADGSKDQSAYYVFADDNSGKPRSKLFAAPNGHDSYHPDGNWVLTDTYSTDSEYPLNGYEYLYLYHLPTGKFVPLGKFPYKIGGKFSDKDPGIFRVDLHPRFSPDGRKVSFDATFEGLGRQIYLIDVGHILDNPPMAK